MSLYIKINTVYISSISHDPFPSPWSLALAQTSQTALGTLDRRFIRTKITTQNKWYVIYIYITIRKIAITMIVKIIMAIIVEIIIMLILHICICIYINIWQPKKKIEKSLIIPPHYRILIDVAVL
jgi:hypothetical protein